MELSRGVAFPTQQPTSAGHSCWGHHESWYHVQRANSEIPEYRNIRMKTVQISKWTNMELSRGVAFPLQHRSSASHSCWGHHESWYHMQIIKYQNVLISRWKQNKYQNVRYGIVQGCRIPHPTTYLCWPLLLGSPWIMISCVNSKIPEYHNIQMKTVQI